MVKFKSFEIKIYYCYLIACNILINFFNNMHEITWNCPDTSECLFDLCLVD